ncbi:hypothetical protein B0T16DRAFT_493683 [Cercophora newfieldiana]|uniref:DNA2/NAM7 helicase-like C-terminal domain-containing protein n=1 Tax=Cercophora newfieldiana TaxID=92897 RepID=A0AA39Y669_9PEZI|nr:hypothetical protein B0T16DRAFT_493683 [Cercophora newfieldiana]
MATKVHKQGQSPLYTSPKCDTSLETWMMLREQNQQDQTKTCRWGENCPHNQDGNCFFYHPPEHHSARPKQAKHGLSFLETLDLDSLAGDRDVCIQDDVDLASFNKLTDGEIIVPGAPPKFFPITGRTDIKLDARNHKLQTHFPQYTYSFEPLVRSVQIMDPYFDFDKTALVTNASNLRKLFHFFRNEHRVIERFDMEFRRSTMFMSKWNGDPSLNSSMGHGAGFERKTCRYPYDSDKDATLRVSASHHRVVRYRFSGLDCVIQSEVDAYHCSCDHSSSTSSKAIPTPTASRAQTPTSISGTDDGVWTTATRRRRRSSATASSFRAPSSPPLSASSASRSPKLRPKKEKVPPPSPSTNFGFSAAPSMSMSTSPSIFNFGSLPLDDPGDSPRFSSAQPEREPPGTTQTLHVHHIGVSIPSPCLLEVKTASASAPTTFTPEAQLYFSRRRKLYTAKHKAGVFVPEGVAFEEDKTEDLMRWERENQAILGKMGALLRMVWWKVRTLSREGVERVSLVCESDGEGELGRLKAELGPEGRSQPSFQRKQLLESLRLATVDNFQGEEAQVVIVSLVRSNESRKVGFLRTKNRINVLLSRAQHGLHLIGNKDTYTHVPMWATVHSQLEAIGAVGTAFNLCCPRHTETPIQCIVVPVFAARLVQEAIARNAAPSINCGHFFTAESLDGLVSMGQNPKSEHYVDTVKKMLEAGLKLRDGWIGGAKILRSELEELQRLMRREWYEKVTEEEIKAIKAAVVSGSGGIATHSGHW